MMSFPEIAPSPPNPRPASWRESLAVYLQPRVLIVLLLGFSSGLFAVPLNAWLQEAAGAQEKGKMVSYPSGTETVSGYLAAPAGSAQSRSSSPSTRSTPWNVVSASSMAAVLARGEYVAAAPAAPSG